MTTESDLENGMSPSHSNWPFIINLSNSIIGIAVLALPFCFKECGLILGLCLLMASAWITDVTCHMLMKLSAITKRRSYEYLALHVFGVFGKFTIEISIIGLLIGTCVAFYIIIGDIGPVIVSNLTGIENTNALRTVLLITVTLFGVLPLGMMQKLDSLSRFSAVSLSFYCCFTLHVIASAFTNFFSGVWIKKVVYWNPDGLFKCLPIFALSYSCQTQLFILCESLPEPSVKHMNVITRKAVLLVSSIYCAVGIFGYIAFYDHEITGDILMNFNPTLFSDLIKLGFVTSTIISFPLVIFPCRASIYTLLFAANSEDSDQPQSSSRSIDTSVVIPSIYFKTITLAIVTFTLCIGIAVPNVEFMLAITGATMGSLICFIFPAVMSMTVASLGHGKQKLRAQFVLSVGIAILLASTYTTLSEQEKLAEDSVVKVAKPIVHQDHGGVAKLAEPNNVDGLAMHIEHRDREDVVEPIEQEKKENGDAANPGEKDDQENAVKPVELENHKDLAQPIPIQGVGDVARPVTDVFVVNEPIRDRRKEPPNPQEPVEHHVVPERPAVSEKPSPHVAVGTIAVDAVREDAIEVKKNKPLVGQPAVEEDVQHVDKQKQHVAQYVVGKDVQHVDQHAQHVAQPALEVNVPHVDKQTKHVAQPAVEEDVQHVDKQKQHVAQYVVGKDVQHVDQHAQHVAQPALEVNVQHVDKQTKHVAQPAVEEDVQHVDQHAQHVGDSRNSGIDKRLKSAMNHSAGAEVGDITLPDLVLGAVQPAEQLVKNADKRLIEVDDKDKLAAKDLVLELQKQRQEQEKLLQEQREIVAELRQHQIDVHKIDDKHWHQDAHPQIVNKSDSLGQAHQSRS